MNNHCINQRYSTTRFLTSEVPIVGLDPNEQSNFQLFLTKGSGRSVEGGLRVKGCFKHTYHKESDPLEHSQVEILAGLGAEKLPLITIVTVVFNGEAYLEKTIQSVIYQTYPNIEYIIVDGGSTDRTIEIIRTYDYAIDYWVSESDCGIYDAMNKGISLASGEWLFFLGADDELNDLNVISEVFLELALAKKSCMLVFGKVVTDKGKIINSRFDCKIFLHNTLHHQSCFYKKSIYKNIFHDTSLRMLADYEINLMAYVNKLPFYRVNHIISRCRDGGVSTDKRSFSTYILETNIVRKRYVSRLANMILKIIFVIKSYLHYAIRYI